MNQLVLFEGACHSEISIDESAERIGVSTATIRNWIKTNHLEQSGNGVTLASIEYFERHHQGKSKLQQRANKAYKDAHDHETLTSKFLDKIQSSQENLATLGTGYELCLSDSYKNKEGVYYTPKYIVEDLLCKQIQNIETKMFCDPCCGSGNFILQAIELGFKPENVYGFDTDPVAVALTKARILQATGYKSQHIQQQDFLSAVTHGDNLKFDYIFTNPPWGKKISKEEKEYLALSLEAGNSKDTSSLFFFACLQSLRLGGRLGLLLPESFFNISAFEHARRRVLSLSLERLIDYGKVFKGLVTKAQGLALTNAPATDEIAVTCEYHNAQKSNKRGVEKSSFKRSVSSFCNNPKAILNHYCDCEDAAVIAHLMSLPHSTLKNSAKWGLGIVTGNNKHFIKTTCETNHIPVYKGADITKNGLKLPTSFIPKKFDLYQQVAPLELFYAREKLIYKFISSKLCFFYDNQQRFVLNSANMLILNDDFAIDAKVLTDLLNSDFMNWIFQKIFNTHKILRGDLESLPIFSKPLKGVVRFNEVDYLAQIGIEKVADGTYRVKA